MPTARARGIEDKIAKPLEASTPSTAPRRPSSRSRSSKMSLAVREVSVAKGYDPRDFALVASGGAGRCTSCAIARELHIPTRDRAAVPVALLGARHAAGRRAPRLRPHLLLAICANVDFAAARSKSMTRCAKEARPACAAPRSRAAGRSSTSAMSGQEFTLSGAGDARADRSRATARRSATRSTQLYEHRYAHHSPEEPVEMVNIRLARDRQAADAEISARWRRPARNAPHAERTVCFAVRQEAGDVPGLSPRDARPPARTITGPAIVQEHGTTTVLFPRTITCSGPNIDDRVRRSCIITHQRCEVSAAMQARSRHARSDPQCACRRSPTRWRPICSAPPTT